MLNWIERNDARVVRRVLAGQREEFGQLVEVFGPSDTAWRAGDFAEAEDVAQEAFVKAMTSLDQLSDHSKFGAWLLTITRNLCCRVYARREYDARAAEQVKPAPADSLAPVEQRELRELLHAQMASLSEEHREVLLLHYFAGMKLRDIARHLELKRDAVAKRLQRAREALGDRMLRHVKDSRFSFAQDPRRGGGRPCRTRRLENRFRSNRSDRGRRHRNRRRIDRRCVAQQAASRWLGGYRAGDGRHVLDKPAGCHGYRNRGGGDSRTCQSRYGFHGTSAWRSSLH